jgi:hypothetical protein
MFWPPLRLEKNFFPVILSGPLLARSVCSLKVGGARMNKLLLQSQQCRRECDISHGSGSKLGGQFFLLACRMDPIAYAELLKESGNQVLKNGNFSLAIRKYDEAIQILLQVYQWG